MKKKMKNSRIYKKSRRILMEELTETFDGIKKKTCLVPNGKTVLLDV